MKINRKQAQHFLKAIRPSGDGYFIDTHMSAYLGALVGFIPNDIPWDEGLYDLADILRQIADHISISEREIYELEKTNDQ